MAEREVEARGKAPRGHGARREVHMWLPQKHPLWGEDPQGSASVRDFHSPHVLTGGRHCDRRRISAIRLFTANEITARLIIQNRHAPSGGRESEGISLAALDQHAILI